MEIEMRIGLLCVTHLAVLGLLGGSAAAQAAPAPGCPCFHYNGAQVHETYTEYSARNDCAAAVNYRSKAAQIGWTKWFEKGETKTWRCEGGRDRCGELTWQRFDSCPTSASEASEPQGSKSPARKSGGPGPGHKKPVDQPPSPAPAR